MIICGPRQWLTYGTVDQSNFLRFGRCFVTLLEPVTYETSKKPGRCEAGIVLLLFAQYHATFTFLKPGYGQTGHIPDLAQPAEQPGESSNGDLER